MERVDKTNYYLDIAETILERGTCLRNNYGSVIVKHDEIISTGYSGAPRGRKNCLDLGYCIRKQKTNLSGAGYEMCRSVHSEQNAIISANRRDMLGATLYLVGINAGIEKVVMRDDKENYRIEYVEEWIKNDDTLN